MSNVIINVFNSGGNHISTIKKVLSATFRDALDGECTFDFVILSEMASEMNTQDEISLIIDNREYVFNIVRIAKTLSNGLKLCTVTCEHKSYELNEEQYNLTSFEFLGDPLEGLQQILEGTNFIAGHVDYSGSISFKINQKCSRRAALMQYVALLGGEIEYSGNLINIRAHRGSSEFTEVMHEKVVSDISVTYDSRSNTSSYGLKLYKKINIVTGDNVHILFQPFGIDIKTRIIAMSYNPFNRREINIEVGTYLPSISDQFYRIENNLNSISNRVESIEKISTKYTAEFSEVIGSGTFYFRTGYKDRPTYFIRSEGGTVTMEYLMSDENYVGATIVASNQTVVTSIVFYCTLPEGDSS